MCAVPLPTTPGAARPHTRLRIGDVVQHVNLRHGGRALRGVVAAADAGGGEGQDHVEVTWDTAAVAQGLVEAEVKREDVASEVQLCKKHSHTHTHTHTHASA